MKLQFNNLADMKEFAKNLGDILSSFGFTEAAKKVKEFSYNSFTTSSEYLGEFRIVLNDLIKSNLKIDKKTKANIKLAIESINRAFGNTI